MVRMFAREVALSLLVLALVVAAAWAVDTGVGPFVVPRGSPTSGLGPTPPARDLLYLLLALAGLGVVGRVVRQVALRRRLGYAPIAHLLKALRRPVARRLTALAGVALAVGGGPGGPRARRAPPPPPRRQARRRRYSRRRRTPRASPRCAGNRRRGRGSNGSAPATRALRAASGVSVAGRPARRWSSARRCATRSSPATRSAWWPRGSTPPTRP